MLAYLVDTRGGDGVALLSLSMLAGMGLLKLSAWISRSDSEQPEGCVDEAQQSIPAVWLHAFIYHRRKYFDFQLINTSLKSDRSRNDRMGQIKYG